MIVNTFLPAKTSPFENPRSSIYGGIKPPEHYADCMHLSGWLSLPCSQRMGHFSIELIRERPRGSEGVATHGYL